MNRHNSNPTNNPEPLSSVKYYDENASCYIAQTKNADVAELQERFLSYIDPGGRILDLGCGSGRDSLAFVGKGYEVYAMDASVEMVRYCRSFLGPNVVQADFENYEINHIFDGIWACASLIHVPRKDIVRILSKYAAMIRPGGVFYMSYKLRDEDYSSGDRVFTCFTESGLDEVLKQVSGFEKVEYFVTQDVRPQRESEKWLNAIAHVGGSKSE